MIGCVWIPLWTVDYSSGTTVRARDRDYFLECFKNDPRTSLGHQVRKIPFERSTAGLGAMRRFDEASKKQSIAPKSCNR